MGMMNRKELKKCGYKPGDRLKPKLVFGPSKTKQEFAKESDINHVMARYPGNAHLGPMHPDIAFADVSGVGDMADVLRRGDAAREAFMRLPAKLRTRFNNDAYAFLDFLADRKNYDEAVSLGLIEKKAEPAEPAPSVSTPKA